MVDLLVKAGTMLACFMGLFGQTLIHDNLKGEIESDVIKR